MFSGEFPRSLFTSAAAADIDDVVTVDFTDNITYVPLDKPPFTLSAIPNQLVFRNNVGLLNNTQPAGGGNAVSGYSLLGAQSVVDVDSQYLRLYSAGSENIVRDTLIARAQPSVPLALTNINSAICSIERLQDSENADYTVAVTGNAAVGTIANDAGVTVQTIASGADGQFYQLTYTSALTDVPDGPYTLLVDVTVVGLACEVQVQAGDCIRRFHLPAGHHEVSLPFTWEAGTTTDQVIVYVRDMPNGAYVLLEPIEIFAGYFEPNVRILGNAAPSVNGTHRWLVGSVVWNSAPASGGNIGWICTTSSTRVSAKLFTPGTWKTFGAIS
jgi:hypothetical protein